MPRLSLNRMPKFDTKEEMARRKAFEKKMERLVQENAFKGAYDHFQRELPPPGHTRPIFHSRVPNVKTITEHGQKRIPRSRTNRARPVKTRKSKPKRQ